jgi:protein TonB
MSEQSHCWNESPIASSGPRSIAKALLISLCVHAALVGVLWQSISSQHPAQRELRVDLMPGARPIAATATATASVPDAPKRESSVHKIKGSSDPLVHARAPVEQPAASVAGVSDSAATASSQAPRTDLPAAPEAANPQQGMLPIDLRVVDWLARYRTYPLAARRARIEGVVQLRVTLLPDGRLVDARVEHSSGHPMLDQAALDLLARAAPLPSDFGSTRTAQIELQLPIVYRMRISST